MRQRCGSCCQKNGRARRPARRSRAPEGRIGLSERRACSIVGADRTMVRYRSRRPPDTELRARLRELANERRRFGYRRLFILLRREGERSGINRIHRLYREEGLAVRKRRARRKAVGVRVPILLGSPRHFSILNPSMGCASFWLTGSEGEPIPVPEMSLAPSRDILLRLAASCRPAPARATSSNRNRISGSDCARRRSAGRPCAGCRPVVRWRPRRFARTTWAR